jgi:riboflavin synthase
MFSGIVEELGKVKSIVRRNPALIEIEAGKILEDASIGASIAVNGVCLTIVKASAASLSFEVMPETMKVTNLGDIRIGDKVNLERSLKIGQRISGHFVTGHIDCTGIIRKKVMRAGNLCFDIALNSSHLAYILPKGSIAVDGISLTVMDKKPGIFCVYIIPHTLKNTTLGFKGPSCKVNLEFDILAKKLLSK